MFKFTMVLGFLALMVGTANADLAIFRSVHGKVEFQVAGSEWKPAKPGTSIPEGAWISTGFRSSAVVNLDGSYLTVKPLTRLTISTLLKNRTGAKVSLFLLAGKVRTEVKPAEDPTDNLFVVKSPTATASVRGTGFEFDGVNLLVNHGVVVLTNSFDFSRHVEAGEFASAHGTVVTPPVQVVAPEKPFLTSNGGDDQNIPANNSGGGQTSELTTAVQTFGHGLYTGNTTGVGQTTTLIQQAITNTTTSQKATVAVTVN